jgi:hypothetical protein
MSQTLDQKQPDAVKVDRTYHGRDDQRVVNDDGLVEQSVESGTVEKEQKDGVFSWLKRNVTWSGGTEQHETTGDQQTVKRDTSDKTWSLDGKQAVTTKGSTTEIIDVRATGVVAKKQLEDEKGRAQQELENAKPTGDKQKAAAIEERIANLDGAISAIDKAPDDAKVIKGVCQQHGLYVEPKLKTVAADSVTTKDKLDIEYLKGGLTKSTETTEMTGAGGNIRTTTAKQSASVDMSAGKLERKSSNVETKLAADGSSESKSIAPSTTTTVKLGGGQLALSQSATNSRATTGPDGKPIASSSETKGGSTSLFAGKAGIGIMQGTSSKKVIAKGSDSREVSTDANVGIGDKGVLGDASAGVKSSGKKSEVSIKVKANGALLIEVLPPDETSDQYRIVTTVRAGVALGGGGGTKKKEGPDADKGKQGSVSIGVDAGATLVYSHAMTQEQAKLYLSEADRAELATAAGGGGGYPEFGILAKLNALAHGENGINPAAVMGSSASAAEMPAGDSVKLVLSAGAQAKIAGSNKGESAGIGAEASAKAGKARTLALSKDKDGMVHVSIGFVDSAAVNGELEGSLLGASAKVGLSKEGSDGDACSFKLDPRLPDYQTCFDTIVSTWSRAQLEALRTVDPIRSHLEKQTHTQEHKDGMETGFGGAGVMFNAGKEKSGSSEISKSATGPEGSVSGGQTDTASISVGGVNLVGVTQSNTASSNVDESGKLSTDLQTGHGETDLGKTLSGAGKTIKGWFGIKDDKPTKASDVLKGALEKTPGERVKELLEKQYTRLSGYQLGERDIVGLILRARDHGKWMSAVVNYRAIEPMEALRDKLLNPDVDMSLVTDRSDEQQIDKATKLALAAALADFMESTGRIGMEAIVNVMQNYGGTMTRESTAADLGSRYDWPPSLGKARMIYEKAEAAIGVMPSVFADMLEQPDGKETWHALSDKLIKDLDAIHAEVAKNQDIRSERARAEMLDSVSKKKASLLACNKYFERAIKVQNAPSSESAEALQAWEAQVGRKMLADERIPTLLVDLAGFKIKERELFNAGYKAIYGSAGGKQAQHLMTALRELYEFWIARIKELRDAYRTADHNGPWAVSKGPDDKKRTSSTEPYVEGMIDIWKDSGGEDYNVKDWAAIWRERFGHY